MMCRKHAWMGLCLLVVAGCAQYASPFRCGRPALLERSSAHGPPVIKQRYPLDKDGRRLWFNKQPDSQFDQLVLTRAQDERMRRTSNRRVSPLWCSGFSRRPFAGGDVKPISMMPDAKNVKEYQEAVKKYSPDMPDIGPEPTTTTRTAVPSRWPICNTWHIPTVVCCARPLRMWKRRGAS